MTAPNTRIAPAPDGAILAAWDRYSAARAAYDRLPFSDGPGTAYTPEEAAEVAAMDAAEKEIQAATAETPLGVEKTLWLAMLHTLSYREEDAAAARCDLAYFLEREESLDWNARLILSAIRSLREMGGAA